MKRDLKLNMSHLDAISRKVQSYIDAMEAVGLAARKFEQTIKDQDSDAYNKLSEQWETNVWENEKILKYRLGVIKEMIDSYISDMTDYIAPENETAMMRVDRNDIWWNYKQIEGEATSFDWIVQDTGSTLATYKRLFIPNPFSSDEENEAKKSAQQQEEDAESARRQRNYEKLQGFRDQLDTSIRKKLSDSVDEIKKIYENKVIPFENTDDSYKSKMSAYYSEWSSMGDKFSDAGNAIRDFLAGIGDSLVDTVKGLLTLVVDLGILYVDVRWKSIVPIQVPEVLDQEVEKIKQKYEPLLKDPVNTIGGIGQSICDTADEKGVAYSSGYIVTEVVTALLADKGLDKIKNVAKTGKTADNVADIAEGAAKGAGNAAEDAGKAGKGLEEAAKGAESAAEDAGKVVESGRNTGTVWDNITSTADNMPATEIPATFKIDLDGNINYVNPETGTNTLWTNSNATKHMGEYVSRFGDESWSIGTRSQVMLESYSASLNKAMETIGTEAPGRYFGTYGNWELGINTETGVVYHARMIN